MSQDKKENLRTKTIKNFFWRFAERFGAQIVNFVVSIYLARILSPQHYGQIALVNIFITILQVFVDSGLGNALIQKKDADNLDFSTVFYFNITFCILLYTLIFFLAPLIAEFYNDLTLISVIRVSSLVIVVSGLKNVQQAFVSRNLLFKKFFLATLSGTIIAAVLGILMAKNGFGVWALIAQHLTNVFIDTVILWIVVKWRPELKFSFSRLKILFNYGWKILVSHLINTIYIDLRQLIIGKFYTSSDLAYYNKGKQFPNLVTKDINSAIDSVLFPVLSKKQNDKIEIKKMIRKSMTVSSFFMWPLMLGMIATSENIILLLLTEKWLPCIPFMCICCFNNALEPIQTSNLNGIKAIGRSDIFLKLEILKKSIGIVIIAATMKFGVLAIALGTIAYSIIATFINSFPNKKLLNYSYLEQLKDIFPSFILSVIMAVIIFFLPIKMLPIIVQLIIQVIVGIAIYFLLAKLFHLEVFEYIIGLIKNKINKKNN